MIRRLARLARDVRCLTCDGYGYVTGAALDGSPTSSCPDCGGQGFTR